jgi:toxin CcdB
MNQFTLFKNEDKATRKTYPYFLNVQSDLLDDLNSRMVIPFSSISSVKNINAKKLCPIIMIEDKQFVLLPHQMTAVPASIPPCVSLSVA